MLKDGLIVELRDRVDPAQSEERRRYYRLTDLGQRVLRAEAQRLEELVREARGKRILPGLGGVGGA